MTFNAVILSSFGREAHTRVGELAEACKPLLPKYERYHDSFERLSVDRLCVKSKQKASVSVFKDHMRAL